VKGKRRKEGKGKKGFFLNPRKNRGGLFFNSVPREKERRPIPRHRLKMGEKGKKGRFQISAQAGKESSVIPMPGEQKEERFNLYP